MKRSKNTAGIQGFNSSIDDTKFISKPDLSTETPSLYAFESNQLSTTVFSAGNVPLARNALIILAASPSKAYDV
jgi:hypothetical protein